MAKRQGKTKKSQPGRLRIVAGNWRSRLLEIADVPGLRPTAERVRETLFNWLSPVIEGARCLDLYAGTGALGLEALSRGAGSVVFVETSAKAADALQRNVDVLEARGATIERRDAFNYMEQNAGKQFDIVFVDPPFAQNAVAAVCRRLDEHGLCKPGANVYLEEHRSRELPKLPRGWVITKERTAGNVRYALVTITTA